MTLEVKYIKRRDFTYINIDDVDSITNSKGKKYFLISEREYKKMQNEIIKLQAEINARNIFMENL